MTDDQWSSTRVASDQASAQRLSEDDLIEQLNQGYVCPAEAGPNWRAAHEAGVDMALLEEMLRMTPAERLRRHQRALELVLRLQGAAVKKNA